MKLFGILPTREDLSNRLFNFPTLRAILSVLLFEPRFRWTFLFLVAVLVTIPILFLKIWTVTPSGHRPKARISIVDFIQAETLRRSARKADAAGDRTTAARSWLLAVANNPGRPDLVREALSHMAMAADRESKPSLAVRYSRWLLMLTATNQSDVEFTAGIYERFGLHDLAVQLLQPRLAESSIAAKKTYLRSLFNLGAVAEFEAFWDKLEKEAGPIQDEDLQIYRAAHHAGWAEAQKAVDGKAILEKAKSNPSLQVLAHRLSLRVSEHLAEVEDYRASLEFLKARHLHTLSDEVGLWRTLNAAGRRDEAIQLVRTHVAPPENGQEATLLAKTCMDFGLLEEAKQILERYTPVFKDFEAIWLIHSTLLTQMEKWEDLRKLALRMRNEDNPLRTQLLGYSYYLEGHAELKEGRTATAQTAFDRIGDYPIPNTLLALATANQLEHLGQHAMAQKLLLQLKEELPDIHEYWMLLSRTAFQLQDAELLLTAMRNAHELRPTDVLTAHNYAAALLATRRNPQEAIRLTLLVMNAAPDRPLHQLNHAAALIQNQRHEEAKELLRRINTRALGETGRASYSLAWAEILLQEQQYEEAAKTLEQVDLNDLFVTEKEWVEQAKRRLQLQASKQ